jgi:hypothetical protein
MGGGGMPARDYDEYLLRAIDSVSEYRTCNQVESFAMALCYMVDAFDNGCPRWYIEHILKWAEVPVAEIHKADYKRREWLVEDLGQTVEWYQPIEYYVGLPLVT